MKRLLLAFLTAITVGAVGPIVPASAGDAISSALPAGSRIEQYVKVPAIAGAYAVTYVQGGWHLGLVEGKGGQYALRWKHSLTGTPVRLATTRQGDVFRVLTRTESRLQFAYAFEVRGALVSSAFARVSSGRVSGTGGIVWHSDGFSVRQREPDHVGAVAYRSVTRYVWKGGLYRKSATSQEPDYGRTSYPKPSGWVTTTGGDTFLLRLEVAATEMDRETGLMNREKLDPDSGMIFTWGGETHESFWMENTLIPLSVAFLGRDGTVQEIQDMQAETLDYHTPEKPYWYAVEANLSYFQSHGIKPGDRFHLQLQP